MIFFSFGSIVVKFRIGWMPRNNPNYKVARDALMRNFERELNFDENLLAGIYTVKQNSLNVKCKYLCSIQYVFYIFVC